MRFSLALVASALAALVSSQATEGNNAFSVPASGDYLLTAGKPQTFNWTKLSGSTVTLQLRDGDRSDLSAGTVIVANLPNTGTYTWNVPADTVEGANYAIEIINDSDPSDVNYTPQFVIQSTVKAVPTASGSAATTGSVATAATGTSSGAAATTTASAAATETSGATVATTKTSSPSKTSAASSSTAPSSTASPSVPATNSANGLKAGGAMLALAVGVAIVL